MTRAKAPGDDGPPRDWGDVVLEVHLLTQSCTHNPEARLAERLPLANLPDHAQILAAARVVAAVTDHFTTYGRRSGGTL